LKKKGLELAKGDHNTSFFHAKAKQRGRRNKSRSFRRTDGSVVTLQEGLENEAIGFYQNLFTTQDDTNSSLVVGWVTGKDDDSMNDQLCVPITYWEIEKAFVYDAS
jgi:hypothetical protein